MITRARSLRLAAPLLLAAGCAAPAASSPVARMPESAVAQARPEPDPACRSTVQDSLRRNRLDQVSVRVSVDPSGRADAVSILSPDLTPAATVDLQRAFAGCLWAPIPAEGGARVWTTWTARRDTH
jgi:hypothetical protein